MLTAVTVYAPSAPSYDCSLSSEGALLAAIIYSQCTQRTSAEIGIEVDYERLEELKRQIAEALEEARKAEEDSGFWGDIADFFSEDLATIAGAIAAAAAIVATGGTGAPLVLAVIATGLEVGAKIGAELGLDPRLSMLMGLAGAALGLLAGNTGKLGDIASLAGKVEGAARVVQGGAAVVGGVSGAVAQSYQSDALEARSRVSYARGREDDVYFRIDEAIARIRSALADQARAVAIASSVTRDAEIADRNVTANVGGR